uniref:Uncharacterized protein n=1 Tax=Tanacetum cinerariifolium TaxID=118510 RepID=A0A6L2J9J2_TANCI|nr:hypothetical protein [Tanacetum cinerariifolium]
MNQKFFLLGLYSVNLDFQSDAEFLGNDPGRQFRGLDFRKKSWSLKKPLPGGAKGADQEASAAWMKSSTNIAWNLDSRISGLERAQTHIKPSISSFQKDTSSIKSIMTEMYNAFRGQSSSAPSSSVTSTFALTDNPTNVEGENATNTTTKESPSHTEGEADSNTHDKPE